MKIEKVTCPACGAPVNAPVEDQGYLCPYCGSLLSVANQPSSLTPESSQVHQAVQALGAQISRQLNELQNQEAAFKERLPEFLPSNRPPRPGDNPVNQRGQRILDSQPLAYPTVATTSSAAPDYPSAPISSKSWLATTILCLSFGVFGLHRFYTGYPLVGLIQLLTGGGFMVWWLVDLVHLLANKYHDSAGYLIYNANALRLRGCVSGLFVFAVITVLCPFGAVVLQQLVNGSTTPGSETVGIFFLVFVVIGLVAGLVVSFYSTPRQSNLWQSIKDRLS